MEDPQAAIQAGVIVQQGVSKQGLAKFLCRLCQELFTTNVQTHIHKDSHRNIVSWEAVNNPSASRYLLSLLPNVVRTAKKSGDIQAVDRRIFSYVCKVCSGKEPFTGLQPLQDHLNGKDHNKFKNLDQMTSATRISTSSNSSTQKISVHDSSASVLPPEVQTLLRDKTIKLMDSNGIKSFICAVCNNLSMTGVEPLMQHIEGSKHKKNAIQKSNLVLVPDSPSSTIPPEVQKLFQDGTVLIMENNGINSFMCVVCNNLPLTGVEPLMQHIHGSKHKKNEVQKHNLVLVPDSPGFALPPEVKTVLQDKTVEIMEEKGITYFICLVCNNLSMTGVVPLLQHIQGSKHKNNAIIKAYRAPNSASFSQQLSGIMVQDTSNSSQIFPTANKNKKVVVLNYKDFPKHIGKRPGATKDSENLSQIFTSLGYDVIIHENLTALDTEDVLKRIQLDTLMECLILIILSHGKSKYCFYTREGGIMDLDKIRKKFTDTACPQLRGKPKIFLSNFCRGQDIELQTDSSAQVEVPHHMVTIHASVGDIKVLRHPKNGTIFISSLCKVLKHGQGLQETLNKLNETMKQEGGTTPMMEAFAPFPEFTF